MNLWSEYRQNPAAIAVRGLLKHIERAGQQFQIIGVSDAGYIPAIAHKAGGNIFAERQFGLAFNGDVVVVVNPAEIAELEMPGQGSGLTRHAFHHVTITTDGVNAIIEQLNASLVEMLRLPFGGDRHAYAVGHALA